MRSKKGYGDIVKRFTAVIEDMVALAVTTAQPSTKRGSKAVKGKRGRTKGTPLEAFHKRHKADQSALKGRTIPEKPCPVTGKLNRHRRFSYLMPEVRTPENLVKFRRAAGKQVAASDALVSTVEGVI